MFNFNYRPSANGIIQVQVVSFVFNKKTIISLPN